MTGLNDHLVERDEEADDANMAMAAPEELMKSWMRFGGQASEQFMKLMTAAGGRRRQGAAHRRPMSDTIFALATAPGRAAVAVVRISGPDGAARRCGAGRARAASRGAPALRTLRDARGAIRSTRRWCSGSPVRTATPARTSPSCTCTAARRWSTR